MVICQTSGIQDNKKVTLSSECFPQQITFLSRLFLRWWEEFRCLASALESLYVLGWEWNMQNAPLCRAVGLHRKTSSVAGENCASGLDLVFSWLWLDSPHQDSKSHKIHFDLLWWVGSLSKVKATLAWSEVSCFLSSNMKVIIINQVPSACLEHWSVDIS